VSRRPTFRARDPIGVEVCRHAMVGVAEEMGTIMKRAAFSAMIKERDDRSCALFTPDLQLVAQAEHLPIHLALLVSTVPAAMRELQPEALGPGDISIHNDPYVAGSHLPDFTTVMPFHDQDGRLLGYSAVIAHMTDVGGAAPGGVGGHAREIFDEGFRLPPVRLYTQGRLNPDVLRIIKSNVRLPDTMAGDILAQAAANVAAERGMRRIVARFGGDTLLDYMAEIVDYTERLTRAEIASLPDGTFEFEDFVDDDGNSDEPVAIRARVLIDGEELTIDFTGSSRQRPGPVNAAYAVVQSAVFYVVRCLIDPSIPTSAGCFRPIHVVAPEGTVVNASFPAPVGGGSLETAQRIVDVLLGAFAQAVPDRVTAAGMGSHNSIAIGGWDAERGRPYVIVENLSGGWGARATRDGLTTTRVNLMNTPNNPVEVFEQEVPVMVERLEVREDSAGGGRQRGGFGLRKEYVLFDDARVSILSDRHRFRPWGLFGGEAAQPSQHAVIDPDGVETPLPSKVTITIPKGHRLLGMTAGGGGYGDPAERAPNAVQEDIREGLIHP
jgi:N-methylhydantoinase B